MTSSLRGLDDLNRNMAAAAVALRKATEGAIYLEANNILADSVERTPLDLGPLRASAYVTHPTEKGGTTVVEIGYGGPAAEYARVQHEHDEFRHKVGEAKFLETAIDVARKGYQERIAAIASDLFETRTGMPSGGFPTTPGSGQSTRAEKQKAKRQQLKHSKTNKAKAKRRWKETKRRDELFGRHKRW